MKKIVVGLLVLLTGFIAWAQGQYDDVLRQVEGNSIALKALHKQMEAQQFGSRTGIYPSGPELEYHHLPGSPTDIGNRRDISVRQSFDFPTAYIYRGKIASLQGENAGLTYQFERLNLLLSAKRICIDLIYYNALSKEYVQRVQNAALIADTWQVRFERGVASILELNKARLNLVAVQTEVSRIETEKATLIAELKILNGGNDIEFSETHYSLSALPPDFEDWYAQVESKNPAMELVNRQLEIEQQQLKLNRSLNFPKFAVGYMEEKVFSQSYRGITAGLSIPLWENKNRVKQSKAQVQAAEITLKDTRVQFHSRLHALYKKAAILLKNAQVARHSLSLFNNEPLLKKVLDAGEISLINYLLELEYYYNAVDKVLEAERDLELTMAELKAAEI